MPGAGVIVIDNGSTDGTAAAVRHACPEAKLVRLAVNRGFTGGIAAGLAASDADHVIFLNNDAVVEAGWLEALTSALRSAPEDVVAASGKIVDPSGTLIDFIGGVLTFDGHAFQRGFRRPLKSVEEPARGSELLFACGGNMIVRRKEFLALGGFDDDYFAYLEDVDFGWRAWLSGYRIIWEPSAIVRHHSSKTSDRLGAFERGVLFERNALQTAIKNLDPRTFDAATSPIFLTLLHRLHRYVIDRNGDTSELTRPAFGEEGSTRRRGFLGRFRRSAPALSDPLTAMQFRAMEWFFRNSERIMAKRSDVQARRKRPDDEIFERFPVHVVPTYHGDEVLMKSTLFRLLMKSLQSTDARLDDMISR